MDRLIAQYTVPVGSGDTAPATGTPGQATSGNPATNTPATRLPAYAWNALQEELMAVLAGAGIVADRNNNAQVVAAIRRLIQTKTLLADTGSANAYAGTNTPALAALPGSGFVQVLSIANANTGAATYAPDGLAAKPILGMGLAALQGGELPAKGIATLLYVVASNVNSGNGAWVLIECTGGAQQVPSATQPQHAVNLSQLTQAVPAGKISPFAMSAAPSGWLKANGASVSRTAYASLFAAIGTTFGAGDGSTTFNLPDLRGEFVRGWDDSRGIDAGRAFGSWQAQDVQPHTHSYGVAATVASGTGAGVITGGGSGAATTASYGTTETRPRNVALLACIKF